MLSFDKTSQATVGYRIFFSKQMSTCASILVSMYISLHIGHLCEGIEWMTSGNAGAVEMLASFKGGTAFMLTGTDRDDDTETSGEGITFVIGTGVSKVIIEDTGGADNIVEDWLVVMVAASSIGSP